MPRRELPTEPQPQPEPRPRPEPLREDTGRRGRTNDSAPPEPAPSKDLNKVQGE
jgi:hypothetical protein